MADKAEIIMLRQQGLKYREVAEVCGVSQQYVSYVCRDFNPDHFIPVGSECVYPNLRSWMNKNRITRKEFLTRMGLTPYTNNYDRLGAYIRGKAFPRKPYIDKMLEVTGLTYETLFYTEQGAEDD